MTGKLSNLPKAYLWVLYQVEAEIQPCTVGAVTGSKDNCIPSSSQLNKQVTRAIPSLKRTSNLTPFFESSFQGLKLLHKAEIRRKYSKIFRNF